MQIGVALTKSEFEEYGEQEKFKEVFVIKEFHAGFAHYFKARHLVGGPINGSKPQPIL